MSTHNDYHTLLMSIISDIVPNCPTSKVDFDTGLDHYGISSMDKMEILHELMYQSNVTLALANFAGKDTVNDIVNVIKQNEVTHA